MNFLKITVIVLTFALVASAEHETSPPGGVSDSRPVAFEAFDSPPTATPMTSEQVSTLREFNTWNADKGPGPRDNDTTSL